MSGVQCIKKTEKVGLAPLTSWGSKSFSGHAASRFAAVFYGNSFENCPHKKRLKHRPRLPIRFDGMVIPEKSSIRPDKAKGTYPVIFFRKS
ncbi:MAG: hypothetical protein JXA41_09165 [Deltaproteobacteria bacterium]|nr:hypothetical protein [Deltaproteobacteria bacterium]